MSDFLDSMLTGVPANIAVKKISQSVSLTTPILYTSVETLEEIKYTLILDTPITKRDLQYLVKYLDNKISNYQILYALQIQLSEKDLSKTIWSQYVQYKWDYKKYIPAWSKVLSFGKTLFSLIESKDLDCSLVADEDSETNDKKKDKFPLINGFYDTILWKTSFFHPELKCQIFPVDECEKFIDSTTGLFKDSFEYWFLGKQITLMKSFHLEPHELAVIKTVIVDDPNAFLKEHNNTKELIGYDLETRHFDPWNKDTCISCITIAFESDPYTGYYLRYEDVNLFVLSNFLKNRPLVGTNLKFDGRFSNYVAKVPLSNFNIVGDSSLLQHLCNEMMRSGLKSGAWLWTEFGGYDKELDEYIKKHKEIKKDYSKIPEEIRAPYASKDPCVSLLQHKALMQYMRELDALLNSDNKYGYSLEWMYKELMIPTVNMFLDIEMTGMTIDEDILKAQSLKIQNEISILEDKIYSSLKEDKATFKITSPAQLGFKLEAMGWPIVDRGDKNVPSTGETQLLEWEKKGYTLAKDILKYREITKMLGTYIGVEKDKTGMYKWIRNDGKVHSIYGTFTALSLRHTSKEPNGQNWVSHGEKAKIVRSFITPYNDPNMAFLSSDYSGLQLRLACILSKDEQMTQAFKHEGGDIHLRTAFNVMIKYMTDIKTIEEAKKVRKGNDDQASFIDDLRFKAKAINFGMIFGAQASTLMSEAIKPNWKEADLNKYIKANNLEQEVKEHYVKILKEEYKFIYLSTKKDDNMLNAKYYTVAVDVREKFFEAYSGLATWIEVTRNKAVKNGYVQSVYGSIRRLPYLMIHGKGKSINYGYYSNLLNVALNSPVQTMESVVMNRSLCIIWKRIKDEKRKDKIFGQIHDAQEYYLHYTMDSDWREFIKYIHEINQRDYPEYEGIPLECESNLADFYGKKQLWDQGDKISLKDLTTPVLTK